jgi:tRNA (mo5U34)-methyltransferase
MQVYDLAHTHEQYDLVLFMGTFYHLRYPMLALDIVTALVRRLLVFQTLTMLGDEVLESAANDREIWDREAFNTPGWPTMAFIEGEFAGDPTNWWVPNHAGVQAMLRSSGMRVSARPGHEIYLCEPDLAAPCWPRDHGAAELRAATGMGRRSPGRAGDATLAADD